MDHDCTFHCSFIFGFQSDHFFDHLTLPSLIEVIYMNAISLKLEASWLLSDQGQDAWSWRNASQVFLTWHFPDFKPHMHIFSLDRNINSFAIAADVVGHQIVVFILIDKLDEGRWCIGDQLSGLSAAQRVVWKITKLPFASSAPTPLLPQFVSVASQIIESNVFLTDL